MSIVTLLLVVSLCANALLALLLWAAKTDLRAEELQGWLVRRTMRKLRDGEGLVGDERYVARNYLGDKIVDAIRGGQLPARKEARHD